MSPLISVSVDSHIAHIQLANPVGHNKISLDFLVQLKSVLKSVANDTSVRALFMSALGEYFCEGFDFKELNDISQHNMSQRKRFIHRYQKLLYAMFTCSKPIITVVNGTTRAGGVGLVAASDYVVATDNASFELAELLFGLIPAAVMPYLSRRISIQILKRIILTTELLDPTAALQCGMIDKIIAPEQILKTVKSISKQLLRLNTYGVQIMKSFATKIGDGKKLNIITKQSGNILCHLLFRPNVISNIREFTEFGTLPSWFAKYIPDNRVLQKIYE